MADDIVTRINALLIACEASPCDCRCGELTVAAAEIERLRRWKAEAMEVISRWDAIAESVPCELGQRRSDAVAAEIKRLRSVETAIRELTNPYHDGDNPDGAGTGWYKAMTTVLALLDGGRDYPASMTGAERYLAARLADPEYRNAYEEARRG